MRGAQVLVDSEGRRFALMTFEEELIAHVVHHHVYDNLNRESTITSKGNVAFWGLGEFRVSDFGLRFRR